MRGSQKVLRNSLRLTVWCTVSSYRLNRMLLVITMCKFLQSFHDAVQRKWQRQWFLHHDSAPSHTLLVVQQFLAKRNIPVIQPSYSLDLAWNDFCLFPTLKMEDIKLNVMAELQKIPNEAFCHCFQQWQDCGACAWGGGILL
jgi:hypothetical protein